MPKIKKPKNSISDKERILLDAAYEKGIEDITQLIEQQETDLTKIIFISYIMKHYILNKDNNLEFVQNIFTKLLALIENSKDFDNFFLESIIIIQKQDKYKIVKIFKNLSDSKSKHTLLDLIIKKGINVDIDSEKAQKLFDYAVQYNCTRGLKILIKNQKSDIKQIQAQKYTITKAIQNNPDAKISLSFIDATDTMINHAIQECIRYNKPITLKSVLNNKNLLNKHEWITPAIHNILSCNNKIDTQDFCNVIVKASNNIKEIVDIFTEPQYAMHNAKSNNLLFLIEQNQYEILASFMNEGIIFDAKLNKIRKVIKFAVHTHKSSIVNLFVENQESLRDRAKLVNYLIQNVIKNDFKEKDKIDQIKTIIHDLDHTKYIEKFFVKNFFTINGKQQNSLIYLVENNKVDILSIMMSKHVNLDPKYSVVREAIDICINNQQSEILKLFIKHTHAPEVQESIYDYLIQNIFKNGITENTKSLFTMILDNIDNDSYIKKMFKKNYWLVLNGQKFNFKEVLVDAMNNKQYDFLELLPPRIKVKLATTMFRNIIFNDMQFDDEILSILFDYLKKEEKDLFKKMYVIVDNTKFDSLTYLVKEGKTDILEAIIKQGFYFINEGILSSFIKYNQTEFLYEIIYDIKLIDLQDVCIQSIILLIHDDKLLSKHREFFYNMFDALFDSYHESCYGIYDMADDPDNDNNVYNNTIIPNCLANPKTGLEVIEYMKELEIRFSDENNKALNFIKDNKDNQDDVKIEWYQKLIANSGQKPAEYYKIKSVFHFHIDKQDIMLAEVYELKSKINELYRNMKNKMKDNRRESSQFKELTHLNSAINELYHNMKNNINELYHNMKNNINELYHNMKDNIQESNSNDSQLTHEEQGDIICTLHNLLSNNIKTIPQLNEEDQEAIFKQAHSLLKKKIQNAKTKNEYNEIIEEVECFISEVKEKHAQFIEKQRTLVESFETMNLQDNSIEENHAQFIEKQRTLAESFDEIMSLQSNSTEDTEQNYCFDTFFYI